MAPTSTPTPPWMAVARRDLLWLASMGLPITHKAAVDAVQRARVGIGLNPYLGGRASDLVQRVSQGYKLHDDHGGEALFRKVGRGQLEPLARDWRRDWRSLYAPRHASVRAQASQGLLLDKVQAAAARRDCDGTHLLLAHDPVLPDLDVVVATGDGAAERVSDFASRRAAGARFEHSVGGVYFHCRDSLLYVGKTGEIVTRERRHRARGQLDWLAFLTVTTANDQLDTDAIGTAEALLITYWREICLLDNTTSGSDQAPRMAHLRSAAALATAVSAALVRLNVDGVVPELPLLPGIAKGYLNLASREAGRGQAAPSVTS